jgi:hypothetical protein
VRLQCGHDLTAKKAIRPKRFEGFADEAIWIVRGAKIFEANASHTGLPGEGPKERSKGRNNPGSIAKEQVKPVLK